MEKIRITNGIMFAKVMEDERICKGFLERLFPEKKVESIKITEKVDLNIEKTFIPSIDGKGIRVDVSFENDKEIYDIEMQVANQRFLPKRMRYYTGAMDVHSLKAGDSYSQLKSSYVIFICDFDYFGMDESIYQFEYWDHEKGLQLGDESYKIMLNTTCSNDKIPEALKGFFEYVHLGVNTSKDEFVNAIDSIVLKFSKQEGVKSVMTLYEDYVMRSKIERQEGREEGRQEERIVVASNLKRKGIDIDDIVECTGLSLEEVEKL